MKSAVDDPGVTIVVPTFNERENVRPLIERTFAACRAAPPSPAAGPVDMLFVDDNSPDGTAAEIERWAPRFPVRCLVRAGERGLSSAVVVGIRSASRELIVVMDADLSHPPEAIPKLIAAMADPAVQMAIGSRFVPGGRVDLHWPLHRRVTSWCGRLLARPLTPVRDMVAGFFCVRRRSVELDRLEPIGYKIALELIVRHRWTNVVEIPIAFTDRAAGQTKLNLAEEARYLRHLFRLYAFRVFGRGRRSPP